MTSTITTAAELATAHAEYVAAVAAHSAARPACTRTIRGPQTDEEEAAALEWERQGAALAARKVELLDAAYALGG